MQDRQRVRRRGRFVRLTGLLLMTWLKIYRVGCISRGLCFDWMDVEGRVGCGSTQDEVAHVAADCKLLNMTCTLVDTPNTPLAPRITHLAKLPPFSAPKTRRIGPKGHTKTFEILSHLSSLESSQSSISSPSRQV
jgi:hypothetical protein